MTPLDVMVRQLDIGLQLPDNRDNVLAVFGGQAGLHPVGNQPGYCNQPIAIMDSGSRLVVNFLEGRGAM